MYKKWLLWIVGFKSTPGPVLKGNNPTVHVTLAVLKLLLKPKCQRPPPLQPSTQGTFRMQLDKMGTYPLGNKTAAAALSQSFSSTLAWH